MKRYENVKLEDIKPYADNAKIHPQSMSYSDGVQWWMRRNAGNYGVKFSQTSTPVKGATPQVAKTGVK